MLQAAVSPKQQAPLCITRAVWRQIETTIGRLPAEQGGLLGGSRDDGVVRHFQFDASSRRSAVEYTPDHEFLNAVLKNEWNPRGIHLLGFVHSHPPGYDRPSPGDLTYAARILEHNPQLDRLLLPIAMSKADGRQFQLLPYAAVRDGRHVRIKKLDWNVVGDEGEMRSEDLETMAFEMLNGEPSGQCAEPLIPFPADGRHGSLWETFRRVHQAYDLGRLAASRVIYVGVGGAASFAEDLARAGVGEHVLIDPDTVAESNLATQQSYRRDLGRPKVDCLAERLRDINPQAAIVCRQQRLDDIDDADFESLASSPIRRWTGSMSRFWGIPGLEVPVDLSIKPAQTLLCGLTDSFEAQARVNRLALKFGLPSLCAQVYREGRGAEITFTYPGVTPACHRCALSSRYKAYLEQGFKNDVTSDGTPIFATGRLNALKGFVALAILHHGSSHPYWGKLLGRIGNRNLIQIRMDPDLPLPVFERVFGGGDRERILFDDVVWLPQQADGPATGYPACPDCGGTGDLRQAIGTFADTRPMRR